jgi:hypothetical protein
MSMGLALVAAAALATASPSAAPATAPTQSPGPQAVQYVQVQYRNVLKSSALSDAAAQAVGGAVKSQIASFVSNVVQNAISRANPILGFIVNRIVSRMTAKLTNVPTNLHPKPNVTVVAEFEATTTVAPARTRMDVGNISTIVQCDTQQVIVLDNSDKIYSTRSFADSLKDADAGAPSGPFVASDLTQQTIETQPDDGTETIAGLLSHHDIVSAPDAFGFAKTDLWYADVPMANACATAPQLTDVGVVPATALDQASVRIPLRSVQWSEMSLSAPQPPPVPYHDPMLQTPGIAWIETTTVTRLPYDPSLFDIPAGYVLATPEPSPSPL